MDPLSEEYLRYREATNQGARILDTSEIERPLPCAACGGPVPRQGAQSAGGGWRRHRECPTTRAGLIMAILDSPRRLLTEADAQLLAEFTPLPFSRRPGTRATDAPGAAWGFVTRRDRRHLLFAITNDLPKLRVAAQPRPGPLDATFARGCAWCGVGVSMVWYDEGHRCADRTPAALCEACFPVWVRRCGVSGVPTIWRDQRGAMIEAITGVPTSVEDAQVVGVPAWCESHGRGQDPAARPWAYLSKAQVERLCEERWRVDLQHAPEPARARIMAEVAAVKASTAAHEAAAASPWVWA